MSYPAAMHFRTSARVILGLTLTLTVPEVFSAAPLALGKMPGALVTHHTTGSFEPVVKPVPADAPAAPTLGRFTLTKTLHGGIEGTGLGQMLTAMTATKGSAAYVAVEVITGKLDGRSGTFSLVHRGLMDRGEQSLTITVVPDSGTGELAGLAGTFTIRIGADGRHTYDFDYTLPAVP